MPGVSARRSYSREIRWRSDRGGAFAGESARSDNLTHGGGVASERNISDIAPIIRVPPTIARSPVLLSPQPPPPARCTLSVCDYHPRTRAAQYPNHIDPTCLVTTPDMDTDMEFDAGTSGLQPAFEPQPQAPPQVLDEGRKMLYVCEYVDVGGYSQRVCPVRHGMSICVANRVSPDPSVRRTLRGLVSVYLPMTQLRTSKAHR